jgi:hypothetical protein
MWILKKKYDYWWNGLEKTDREVSQIFPHFALKSRERDRSQVALFLLCVVSPGICYYVELDVNKHTMCKLFIANSVFLKIFDFDLSSTKFYRCLNLITFYILLSMWKSVGNLFPYPVIRLIPTPHNNIYQGSPHIVKTGRLDFYLSLLT